jgi:hypothetical protein
VDVVPKPKSKKLTARPKASAAPSVRHQITLHTSRAATLAASQTAPCFGNVLVQIRSGDSLGSLEHYAQEWNSADMGEVTSGLNEARKPIVDPSGLVPLGNHLLRMKRAVKAFDNAWFDSNKAILVRILSFLTVVSFF